jgi:acetoin utilization deacetylase AcuC-like enzyme
MRVSFHPDYRVDLGPTHPFPMGKYPLLHELLLARGLLRAGEVMEPAEASIEMLARVHTAEYLGKLATGTLSDAEVRRLGLRWTERLWRRSRLAAQGTYLAALAALDDGIAANLAGGTHHAYPDHGEGFCVLNDVAVAIEALRHERRADRFLIVDLDVHQGNGTAAIYATDAGVYTLSLHGARNYPTRKETSTRDVALDDGLGDAGYLEALHEALPAALSAARADLVFYLAGVDVVGGDRYGRLGLSVAGLAARERLVLDAIGAHGCPVAITLAGGYAATPLATAQLNTEVFVAAAERGGAPRANLSSRPSSRSEPG